MGRGVDRWRGLAHVRSLAPRRAGERFLGTPRALFRRAPDALVSLRRQLEPQGPGRSGRRDPPDRSIMGPECRRPVVDGPGIPARRPRRRRRAARLALAARRVRRRRGSAVRRPTSIVGPALLAGGASTGPHETARDSGSACEAEYPAGPTPSSRSRLRTSSPLRGARSAPTSVPRSIARCPRSARPTRPRAPRRTRSSRRPLLVPCRAGRFTPVGRTTDGAV